MPSAAIAALSSLDMAWSSSWRPWPAYRWRGRSTAGPIPLAEVERPILLRCTTQLSVPQCGSIRSDTLVTKAGVDRPFGWAASSTDRYWLMSPAFLIKAAHFSTWASTNF
jgi:hypothetical protein